MKHGIWIVATFAFLSMAAGPKRPPVVSLQVPESIEITAGGSADGILHVVVAGGFHVQANPASQEYLIPTKIEVEPAEGISLAKVEYPKGKTFRLQGDSSELLIYEGTFGVTIILNAEKTTPPGEPIVKGKLTYQACDDRTCLPPTSLPFHLKLTVKSGG